MDFNRNRMDIGWQWWPHLGDANGHFGDAAVAQTYAGDFGSKGLDEVPMLAGDDPDDVFGDLAVVDGVVEIVGSSCGAKIDAEGHVDLKWLSPPTFLWEDPVGSKCSDAVDADLIHAHKLEGRGSEMTSQCQGIAALRPVTRIMTSPAEDRDEDTCGDLASL